MPPVSTVGSWAPLAARLTDCSAWALTCAATATRPVPVGHRASTGPASPTTSSPWSMPCKLHRAGRQVGGPFEGQGAALLLAEARRPGTFSAAVGLRARGVPAGGRLAQATDVLLGRPPDTPRTWPSRGSAAPLACPPPTAKPRPTSRPSRRCRSFDPAARHEYVTHGFAEPAPMAAVELKCRPEDEARVYEMGGQHDAWAHLDEVGCPGHRRAGRRLAAPGAGRDGRPRCGRAAAAGPARRP